MRTNIDIDDTLMEQARKRRSGRDSGVWIDVFRGADEPAVGMLAQRLGRGEVRLVVPDLVLFEVLRGFRHERDHRQARPLMETLDVEDTTGHGLALTAAAHHRGLRADGVTMRSPVDVLVATCCIDRGCALLHRDRDHAHFEDRRGLRSWRH